ncbi:hypothetical protein Dimus_020354 [Dionaea muscipula]
MKALLKHMEFKEFLDGKAKVHVFQRLEEFIYSMDSLIKTVADSLKLIGTTVQSFSNDVPKKLNCLSDENQNHSKIIEHKIQLSENYLVHKIEQRFDENNERMKNMEEALATIIKSQTAQTKAQESLTDLFLTFLDDAIKGKGS